MYVKSIHINYGEGNHHSCLDEDINKGFKGEFVYLRPEYTSNWSEAATAFHVQISDHKAYEEWDTTKRDLAKGTKGKYRYIIAEYCGPRKIRTVWLSNEMQGDGHTSDINSGRGGRYLYLCWNYA